MKRYRVEARISKDDYFKVDCTEDDLEFYKALCKYDSLENGGECYYREFPISKNKKVFYAKENPKMTPDEMLIIFEKTLPNYMESLKNMYQSKDEEQLEEDSMYEAKVIQCTIKV